ncbi:MAG: protein-disulfide reductase DsbD family protein [Candidatus Omnitrophota bacterium]
MNEAQEPSISLLGVYLLGLALNLTPCVYPMLSVTLALFRGNTGGGPRTAVPRAAVYVLGIVCMYSALGVVASMTGQLFGSLLQSPVVLLGISVFFLALALGMFGVYTLQMPAWVLQRAGSARIRDLLGCFLSGLLVGVFAAPCIGPPILALLAIAGTRQDPLFALTLFSVLSLGLGTPYLLLGMFSGGLRWLPKAGAWMIWVERAFGVILLSFSLYYFLLAVYPPGLKFLTPLLLLGGAVYLGFVERSGNGHRIFRWAKRIAGGIVIAAVLVTTLFGPRPGIAWEVYSKEKLAAASEEGRPVVLDFYADWCIPCHELEYFTFSDAGVQAAMKDFTQLRVDLTDPEDPALLDLVERFEIPGVPVMLFLDARGEEIPGSRIGGFISAEELVEHLRQLQ